MRKQENSRQRRYKDFRLRLEQLGFDSFYTCGKLTYYLPLSKQFSGKTINVYFYHADDTCELVIRYHFSKLLRVVSLSGEIKLVRKRVNDLMSRQERKWRKAEVRRDK